MTPPKVNISTKPQSINQTVEEEANDRVNNCRHHKAEWEQDIREGYFFTAPHRARSISSRTRVTAKPQDAAELNTSFAFELASDFATVIINTFIPQAERWAESRPGPLVPKAIRDQIKPDIIARDTAIFEAIATSNFYPECSISFIPDIAIGTVAMWIDQQRVWESVKCQAIPLHELEICTGPNGDVDDRFFIQHVKNRDLKALIPEVTLPADIEKNIKEKPKDTVELRRGFWRIWDKTDETWQHVVMVGSRLVSELVITGAGCMPLIVARFNPMKEYAFAPGPTIQSLPDLRQLDELQGAKIENCDLSLRPPISIPDDSMANFEEGIEAGMAYPIRPGTENAIKALYTPPPATVGIYATQDLEQRLKRLHFLDFPEQRGDTPPSATQWLDQMTMAQRRIGTPGLPFWREWCGGVFLRFTYLLLKSGAIKELKVDKKYIALVPYNPAMRAAEQQEVAQAARAIELCGKAFPEEFKMVIDGKQSMENIIEKLGADKLLVSRKKEEVQAAISGIAQLMGGATAGAPAGAQMGAPEQPDPSAQKAPLPVNPMSVRSSL